MQTPQEYAERAQALAHAAQLDPPDANNATASMACSMIELTRWVAAVADQLTEVNANLHHVCLLVSEHLEAGADETVTPTATATQGATRYLAILPWTGIQGGAPLGYVWAPDDDTARDLAGRLYGVGEELRHAIRLEVAP